MPSPLDFPRLDGPPSGRPGRRAAIVGLVLPIALALLAGTCVVGAQTPGRVYRVGFLSSGGSGASRTMVEAYRDSLRQLGWREGGNIATEYRFAEGRFDALPALADELVRMRVDVIFASTTPAAVAARKATSTIPIVMATVGNPVGLGLAASLKRPGGNVTGTSYSFDPDIFAKQLQLLRDAVPAARRVAVLSNPQNPGHALATANVKAAAGSLGLSLQVVEARAPEDFERAFAAMERERAQAVLVVPDPLFGTYSGRIAELTTAHRLPSVHGARSNVVDGGLILYGPNILDSVRQAAAYVDRILKGAKPGDLPIEQPTRFDLVINLKTAKALGLTIPAALLVRADQIIE